MGNKSSSKSNEVKRRPALLYPNKPFTYGAFLDHIVRGDGVYLYDSKKRRYLDGVSGLWNVSLGYNNKQIIRAIEKQVKKVPFVSLFNFSNPVILKLAEKILSETFHKFERVLYTCTGSESIEAAIKISRKFHKIKGHKKKISFATHALSYHGTTFGAMSASGIDRTFSADYNPKVPGFLILPDPVCRCCPYEKIKSKCTTRIDAALDNFFRLYGKKLSGVIVEPIIGSGGIIPLRKRYLQFLKRLCVKYEVLLIFDEVATGFGRTGSTFSFQYFGILPDILCLGKGINSGYLPLAATLISRKICDVFISSGSFLEHFSTQNGNPIACASGIAAIDYIKNKKIIAQVQKRGARLKRLLISGIGNHPNIYEIRGQGLMIGIELVQDRKRRIPYSYFSISNIVNKLKNNGLIVYPFYTSTGAGLSLFPPLTVNNKEVAIIAKKVINYFS